MVGLLHQCRRGAGELAVPRVKLRGFPKLTPPLVRWSTVLYCVWVMERSIDLMPPGVEKQVLLVKSAHIISSFRPSCLSL